MEKFTFSAGVVKARVQASPSDPVALPLARANPWRGPSCLIRKLPGPCKPIETMSVLSRASRSGKH